jgi:hypothetical protein
MDVTHLFVTDVTRSVVSPSNFVCDAHPAVVLPLTSAMAPLADFLLANIPYRLPTHLSSYVEGVTPLSTTPAVLAALASYLAVIFGTQFFMKNQQPRKLTTLFQIHNVLLSSGSFLLLALMLEEIIPKLWTHGLHFALCNEKSWTSVRHLPPYTFIATNPV